MQAKQPWTAKNLLRVSCTDCHGDMTRSRRIYINPAMEGVIGSTERVLIGGDGLYTDWLEEKQDVLKQANCGKLNIILEMKAI